MTTTKHALVTGANSGIGLETARGLARAGFHVLLLCRNEGRATAAKADIDASVPGASTEIVLADLGEQASVHAAVAEVQGRVDHLDVLVNNAGLTLRGKPQTTSEGHDVMFAVNHLGPFLITNLLRPTLEAAPAARVVTVASDAHRWGRIHFDDIEAKQRGYGVMSFPYYGATKLMNILFTKGLATRLEGTSVTANCVHPGAVATNIGAPGKAIAAITRVLLKSPEQGAQTSLYVATSPEVAGVSGSYFSKSKLADKRLAKRAKDPALAERLWQVSAELTGLS